MRMRLFLVFFLIVVSVLESNSQTFDTVYSKYGSGIESIGQRLNGRKVGRWVQYENYSSNVISGEYFYNSIDSTVLCKLFRHGELICMEYRYYVNDSTLIQHGYSQWYDSNYIVGYGTYYYGKPHGQDVNYYPITSTTRVIYDIENYEYGMLQDSFFVFHENGKLQEVGCYKNNERIGIWKEYYENGILAVVGEYSGKSKIVINSIGDEGAWLRTKVDLKKGRWRYYSFNGVLLKVEVYDDLGDLVECYEGKRLKKVR